jgi:hypothetical protein
VLQCVIGVPIVEKINFQRVRSGGGTTVEDQAFLSVSWPLFRTRRNGPFEEDRPFKKKKMQTTPAASWAACASDPICFIARRTYGVLPLSHALLCSQD